MAEELAMAALRRKRAELAGEANALAARLTQMRADLSHLDAAMRIIDPTCEPETIKAKRHGRRGCDWFGRGELGRLILAVLRDADAPLFSMDIARAVMARKGFDEADTAALRRIENMVDGALRRRDALVEREHSAAGWRIKPLC